MGIYVILSGNEGRTLLIVYFILYIFHDENVLYVFFKARLKSIVYSLFSLISVL